MLKIVIEYFEVKKGGYLVFLKKSSYINPILLMPKKYSSNK